MYKKHSVTKNRKKVLKALAMTRRVLLRLVEEAKDELYNTDPSWLDPFPNHYHPTREDKEWAEYARRKRALFDLKQKKFLETRKIGDIIMYRLTEKGRVAAFKDMVRVAGMRRDGNLIMVSYDIPKQENTVRAKLRYMLKDLEFVQIQKSLWATDKDIGKIIGRLISDVGAEKWVRAFESKEIKNQ